MGRYSVKVRYVSLRLWIDGTAYGFLFLDVLLAGLPEYARVFTDNPDGTDTIAPVNFLPFRVCSA